MNIQLIRNATMRLVYAGHTFLTDPMLSRQGEIRSFAGIAPNPTIGLPLAIGEILSGIDGVVVTHTHPDHFDAAAAMMIRKDLPVFCQTGDHETIRGHGFGNVIPVGTSVSWEGITLTRTGGAHGSGEIVKHMGTVSGFVFRAEGEPAVYWAGDTIWCDEVKRVIDTYRPDIIISHSGGAVIPGHDPIIMDDGQTLEVVRAAPAAAVVAVHMESLDHCTVSRGMLRRSAESAGIHASRLRIPEDGEILQF